MQKERREAVELNWNWCPVKGEPWSELRVNLVTGELNRYLGCSASLNDGGGKDY